MTILARAVRLVVAVWLMGAGLAAQSTDPLRLYNEAQARETALRAELAAAADRESGAVRRRVRTLVGAYRDLARLFPKSGVADKALWQGAMLASDAFWKWGDPVDRSSALRAFETLSKSFPASTLTRQVPGQTRRLNEATARPVEPVAAAAAAAAAAPGPAQAATTPAPRPQPAPPEATLPPAPPPGRTQPAAPPTPQLAMLTAIRHEVVPDALRVTLDVDRETAFTSERLDNPARVFVDLQQTHAPEALRDAVIPVGGDVVQRIRVGRHPGGLTRVVVDLSQAGRYSVYSLYDPYRVVIDIESAGPASKAPAASSGTFGPPETPRPLAPLALTRTPPSRVLALANRRPRVGTQGVSAEIDQGTRLKAQGPSEESEGTRRQNEESEQGPRPKAQGPTEELAGAAPAATPTPAPAAAARTGRGDYSLSRQLGLGIARIVIDAGHGGHDPGAKVRGLTEADLVLDIAQRLEQLLRAQPGVEVIQTRRSDVYVSLEERTEIANRAGADLFISIHGNASTNPRTRGVETYVLNFAANPEAEAIAARENAGTTRTMRQLPDIVKAIALNNKVDESRELARFVQDSLHAQLRKGDRTLRNLGVKQAPFMVLVGATMPAILTEVAFVTNRQDGPLLRSPKYRQDVAEALLRGVTRYQQSLKKAPAVAAQ